MGTDDRRGRDHNAFDPEDREALRRILNDAERRREAVARERSWNLESGLISRKVYDAGLARHVADDALTRRLRRQLAEADTGTDCHCGMDISSVSESARDSIVENCRLGLIHNDDAELNASIARHPAKGAPAKKKGA